MLGDNLTVLCISFSLMISDIEHLFLYLLIIFMSFWKNIWLAPLPIFKLNCLIFWLLSCVSFLYILDINSWSYRTNGLQIFSPIPQVAFCFADDFLCWENVLSLTRWLFFLIFAFISFALDSEMYCYNLCQSVLSMLSSRCMVSGPT